MKKLSVPSGAVTHQESQPSDNDSKIVRPAILVHVGEFQSGDGPITFDDNRIKNVVNKFNSDLSKLATDYGGMESIPMGAFLPVLDQHENDSNDRVIGRLTSPLKYEVRDIPKVGKNIGCAVGEITFLGKDTVQRVKDGRIYHLSIGINEEDDSLGETSTVISPAAPGAMLLHQGKNTLNKKNHGGSQMSDQLKKMKAHAERMTKLSAMKESLSSVTTSLKTASEAVKLTVKKGDVSHRLMGLMKAGKMTPAEHKNVMEKIGLTRLAHMKKEDLDATLMFAECREAPVVHVGQRGSTVASDFSELGQNMEKRQLKSLRSETYKDFKRLSGKKLAFKEDSPYHDEVQDAHQKMSGPVEEPVHPGADAHAVPGQAGEKEMSVHMSSLKGHLEAGNIEAAKECYGKLAECMKHGMKHMAGISSDVNSEEYKQSQNDLQKQVDELSTQLARLAGMVSELVEEEKKEGHELAAAEDVEKDKKSEPMSKAV